MGDMGSGGPEGLVNPQTGKMDQSRFHGVKRSADELAFFMANQLQPGEWPGWIEYVVGEIGRQYVGDRRAYFDFLAKVVHSLDVDHDLAVTGCTGDIPDDIPLGNPPDEDELATFGYLYIPDSEDQAPGDDVQRFLDALEDSDGPSPIDGASIDDGDVPF